MKIEKQVINIIFDAGKGDVSVASREAVSGEAFGALPRPKRSGYRFVGWQLDGKTVSEETILRAEEDIRLVAQWEKAKNSKKFSMLKRQKIAIAILAALCVVLIAALLIVNEVITWEVFELQNVRIVDGVEVTETYYVKHVDGKYQLYDQNGSLVRTNLDGYYIVAGGNQYKVDPATGEWSLYATVDVEGSESIGVNGLVLMFEQLQQNEIYSIEVNGSKYAPYCFYRDASGAVRIKGSEKTLVAYDPELYASLCVSSGYTISSKKLVLEAPIDYSVYGLADEDHPTTYTITKAKFSESGECLPDETARYTVKIGNKTLPGGGYYAQLVGRDTVYILPYTIEDTVLQPIEALVKPQVVYPMSMTTFLCVEDFLLGKVDMSGKDVNITPTVAFSFLDLLARNNTISSTKPYVAETELMKGYDINDANASEMLSLLAEMEYVSCVKLGITEEALREYKLDGNGYYIQFKSPVTDANGYTTGYVMNKILISPKTDHGTYYIASMKDEDDSSAVYYDMIVEVDQYYLSFLEWNLSDWYYPNFFTPSISSVPEMKFHINGKDYTFRLDNRETYMFYEASDGTIKQINLSAGGTLISDGKGGWLYQINGTQYVVQSFDLSKGGYYFRIVNLLDGKNTITYEPFDEYCFTIDRDGIQILKVFREDHNGNKKEYTYELTYRAEDGSIKRARQYSLVYRDANNKDFMVMGKYVASGSTNYITDNYRHSYWAEILTKDENGNSVYQWERQTFNNLAEGLIFCDATGVTDKIYEIGMGSQNLKVYCDQFLGGTAHINLLDYTIHYEVKNDKGVTVAKQISALENFRQFYVNLVSLTIEGDIDEQVFLENMGMTTQEYINSKKEDASFSFKVADMAKNTNLYTVLTSSGDKASEEQFWKKHNEHDIVIRFYRYSDRKVMMTLELVEKYDENGNPLPDATKTVGKFYVLTTVLDMIEEDLGLLLNPSLNTPVPERS